MSLPVAARQERRTRYGIQTLHAEWTKLRTVASTGWLLLGTVAATVAVSVTVDAAVTCHVRAAAGRTPPSSASPASRSAR